VALPRLAAALPAVKCNGQQYKTKNKCSFIAATASMGWAALAGLLQVA
jgi:hypothetical protein